MVLESERGFSGAVESGDMFQSVSTVKHARRKRLAATLMVRLGFRETQTFSGIAHQTTHLREWRIIAFRPVRFRTAIMSMARLLSLRNSWNPGRSF